MWTGWLKHENSLPWVVQDSLDRSYVGNVLRVVMLIAHLLVLES